MVDAALRLSTYKTDRDVVPNLAIVVAFVLVAAVLPPVFCHLKKTRLHCPPPRSAEELMHTLILNHIMHTLNSCRGATDDDPMRAGAGRETMTVIYVYVQSISEA